jgi:hypothetical protein
LVPDSVPSFDGFAVLELGRSFVSWQFARETGNDGYGFAFEQNDW